MNIQKCVTKKATLFVKVTDVDLDALAFLTQADVQATASPVVFQLSFDDEEPLLVELGEYAVLVADDILICDAEYFEEQFQVV